MDKMLYEEVKDEIKGIRYNLDNLDFDLVNIKVIIHNIKKLGIDTNDLDKQMDDIGIEIYQFKNKLEIFEVLSKNLIP